VLQQAVGSWWVFPSDRQAIVLQIAVERAVGGIAWADTEGTEESHEAGTTAEIIMWRCAAARTSKGTLVPTRCRQAAHEKGAITSEAFEFDPILRSARVVVKAGGFTHAVTWRGTELAPEVGPGLLLIGVHVYGGAYRNAFVEGVVFGRRVTSKGHRGSFGWLIQGGWVLVDATPCVADLCGS
jgi:hypothetical protein